LRVADESSIKLRVADESSIKLRVADESKAAIPYVGNVADESSIKLRVASESKSAIPFVDNVPDESLARLRRPDESKAIAVPLVGEAPQAMFLGDIKDSSAVATLGADNADSMIQEANVFQRLSNFQSTIQNIASLNRGLEGK
jgi:hypothetical protein